MTLAELRSDFLTLLNRDDCTSDQANVFLVQGMQRIQRKLRIPSMERLLVVVDDTNTIGTVAIPDDLIEPIDLLVQNDGSIPGYATGDMVPLEKMSYRQLQRVPAAGCPRAYGRQQAAFYIRGSVPAACEVHVVYYGEFSPFASDDDENEISASSPDLATYAGLALAGDYFEHPKADTWEARFQQFLDDVQTMGNAVDADGGPAAVASAYGEA